MSKFIMIGLKELLSNGNVSQKPGRFDLVCNKLQDDQYYVLKDFVKVLQRLNALVEKGFKLLLHSEGSEAAQVSAIQQLQAACATLKLPFPPIEAIAVFDAEQYPEVSVSENDELGCKVVGYGQEPGNKVGLRQAFTTTLVHNSQSYVIESDEETCEIALDEGYPAFWLDKQGNLTLAKVLERVLSEQKTAQNYAAEPLSIFRLFDKSTPELKLLGEEEAENACPRSNSDCIIL